MSNIKYSIATLLVLVLNGIVAESIPPQPTEFVTSIWAPPHFLYMHASVIEVNEADTEYSFECADEYDLKNENIDCHEVKGVLKEGPSTMSYTMTFPGIGNQEIDCERLINSAVCRINDDNPYWSAPTNFVTTMEPSISAVLMVNLTVTGGLEKIAAARPSLSLELAASASPASDSPSRQTDAATTALQTGTPTALHENAASRLREVEALVGTMFGILAVMVAW